MARIILSPNAVVGLRVVRWAAWLAVAFMLGVYVTARSFAEPELRVAHPAAHPFAAAQCACSATQGTI